MQLADFHNLHQGETALIVGVGPNLNLTPPEWFNYPSLSCNSIVKYEGWQPTYYVGVDERLRVENGAEICRKFAGIPKFFPTPDWDALQGENIYRFKHRTGELAIGGQAANQKDALTHKGIGYYRVMDAVIQIAWHMGFTTRGGLDARPDRAALQGAGRHRARLSCAQKPDRDRADVPPPARSHPRARPDLLSGAGAAARDANAAEDQGPRGLARARAAAAAPSAAPPHSPAGRPGGHRLVLAQPRAGRAVRRPGGAPPERRRTLKPPRAAARRGSRCSGAIDLQFQANQRLRWGWCRTRGRRTRRHRAEPDRDLQAARHRPLH